MREVEIARAIPNEVLTELALDAAIALDKRLQKQPAEDTVVTELFDTLDGIVNISPENHDARLIPDPRKVSLVTRAYRHIERVSTLQEVINKLNEMADAYRAKEPRPEQMAQICNFCIALHRELLAGAHVTYEDERKREGGKKNAARLF